MRIAVISLIFLLVGACTSADRNLHVEGTRSWAALPTLPESMTQRIEEAATEYQENAPVPRIGLFDIAFPASSSELTDTGGYGVLLITVLSQDRSELPPKRIYVSLGGKQQVLELISATQSPQKPSPNIERVLGANRWDALYRFPVYLMQDGATLSMDFAKNRDAFDLGTFSTQEREELGYGPLGENAPSNTSLQSDALTKMVEREYPGFMSRAP
jgi:hypothetical protein